MARQHFLAGARFAQDQHRGIGRRNLFGPVYRLVHRGIAHDHRVGLAGGRLQDGGDEVGVRRQRQELAGALADGAGSGFRVVAGAAGDDRHRDALAGQRAHHRAHVVREVTQHDVDASVRAQPCEAGIGIIGLLELRPARDRYARCLPEFAGQRAMIRTRIAASRCPIGLDDLRHGHTKTAVVHHHHLATRDQAVVDVDVDRFAELAVQFDHRAAAKFQQLAHLHRCLAEHRTHSDRNVIDRLQLAGAARRAALAA
jgi:hypothetical protein